mgnify:CR=1 FL=1
MNKLLLATGVAAVAATASYASSQECVIDEYAYARTAHPSIVKLYGTSNCESGTVRWRLYEDGKLLMVGTSFVRGYSFDTLTDLPHVPDTIIIRYSWQQ